MLNKKQRQRITIFFLQIIDLVIPMFEKFKLSLQKNNEVENTNGFISLTPTIQDEEDSPYNDAIGWALKNPDIKNIALTGTYGSGKSSIIKTFEQKNKGYKFLNISLASFNDKKEPIPTDGVCLSEKNNQLIELSILQQLFYQVERKELPDSRFKRIRTLKSSTIFGVSLIILLWIISFLVFFDFAFFTDTPFWNLIDFKGIVGKGVAIFTFLVSSLGLVYFFSRAIRIMNNSKINKLNIQSGEFDITCQEDTSILNKHLDEIMYFFEVTNYDVVVIEDLDRFEDKMIFTKLREINELINKSNQIGRKIVFLYAIKDDMFQDKSRTKFFDFIIPVIPVVNPSNAGDVLLRRLRDANLLAPLTETFIGDIALYIDDMRLLYNIFNEYVIYKNVLDSQLDQRRLFAMIVYKNLYPTDFADLHYGKGAVYESFNLKSNFIRKRSAEIDIEIDELRKQIDVLQNEILINENELFAIYAFEIIKLTPSASIIRLSNGDEFNISQIANKDFLYKFKSTPISHYTERGYGRTSFHIDFNMIETSINNSMKFDVRLSTISNKVDGGIENLKNQIQELNKEKSDIRSWNLQSVLELENVLPDNLNDELTIFLLRNGYINENYYDYISIFYEESITRVDRDFILSVKNKKALDVHAPLHHIYNILPRLSLSEFNQVEVLNLKLVEYLFEDRYKNKQQIERLFSLLASLNIESIVFIDMYINEGLWIDYFIKKLCMACPVFWEFIRFNSKYPDEKVNRYMKLILEHSSDADIDHFVQTSELADYISKNVDYLLKKVDSLYYHKIIDIISRHNIQFTQINKEAAIQGIDLFDLIYEKSHYEININNIKIIIKVKGKDGAAREFEERNYSSIQDSECEYLINYIESNINEYISNVFLKIDTNISDPAEAIVILLNNEAIEQENKLSIISKCNFQLESVEGIEDSGLWSELIKQSKMASNWKNIFDCFESEDSTIVDSLSMFLNKEENFDLLANAKVSDVNKTLEESYELFNFIVYNKAITNLGLGALIKSFTFTIEEVNASMLTKEKIILLTNRKIIVVNAHNFTSIKRSLNSLSLSLLESNPEIFIQDIEDFNLDKNDFLELLRSDKFSEKDKLTILDKLFDDDYLTNNPQLCNSVCAILIKRSYESLPFPILKELAQYTESSLVIIQLLNYELQKGRITDPHLPEILRLMKEPYSKIIVPRSKPSFEKNQTNLEFVQHLKRLDFISSYTVKENTIKVNTFND